MPTSKKRQHHHQHTAHNHPMGQGTKKHTKLIAASTVFLALIGLGIAFFAAGPSVVWLLAGAIIGGAIGYFVGVQAEKALLKK